MHWPSVAIGKRLIAAARTLAQSGEGTAAMMAASSRVKCSIVSIRHSHWVQQLYEKYDDGDYRRVVGRMPRERSRGPHVKCSSTSRETPKSDTKTKQDEQDI